MNQTAHILAAAFESSLYSQIETSLPNAQAWARCINSYNRFDGKKVAQMLAAIDGVIPRAHFPDVNGRPNPNNGGATYKIRVGRESSPAIHLIRSISNWLDTGSQLTKEQIGTIENLALEAFVDEFDYHVEKNDRGFQETIRMWWD